MLTKKEVMDNLLNSIAGVLIFISLAHWVQLNGYSNYALLIVVAGVILLFFMDNIVKSTPNMKFITKSVVKTIAYILIFLGTNVYLKDQLAQYWAIFLIIGIILLNNHSNIVKIFGK